MRGRAPNRVIFRLETKIMPNQRQNSCMKRSLAVAAALLLLQSTIPAGANASPPSKQKIRGYITTRTDPETVAILNDQIRVPGNGKISKHDSSGDHSMAATDLQPGMLIEAEGIWTTHHQFAAEKIDVEAGVLDKQIHHSRYLQEKPKQAPKTPSGEGAALGAAGGWLLLSPRTQRAGGP